MGQGMAQQSDIRNGASIGRLLQTGCGQSAWPADLSAVRRNRVIRQRIDPPYRRSKEDESALLNRRSL